MRSASNPPLTGSVEPRAAAPRRHFLDRDWLFALALAFFVGVAVWFSHAIREFFTPAAAGVLVPTFTGQTESDANAEGARLGLKIVVVERVASDRYPKDVVISQDPTAGAHVRSGRQVSLVVSKGVNIFPMPDLRYESLREASLELSRLKLHLSNTKTVNNEEIPSNHVVTQDPAPLVSVREGSSITLTLSKGLPNQVRLPKLTDMDIDQARDLAQKSKVRLGQIVWTSFGPSGPPRGTVVRQNPGPNALVDPFAGVSLQVSSGPQTYGPLVRQLHATIDVPRGDDPTKQDDVRVEVRDETGTWNVYNAYALPGQKLDLNVTAVGTAELNTFINNELQNSTVVGKEPPNVTKLPTGKAAEELGKPKPSPSASP